MPPRAVNRKKAPAKKSSTPKSKQQGLQSSATAAASATAEDTAVFADLDMTALGSDLSAPVDDLSDPESSVNASKEEPEEASQEQEPPKVHEPEELNVLEGEEGKILARQDEKAVDAEEIEIKNEVEDAAPDSMEVEGLERREEVVVSADTDVVEIKAFEEVVEEGKNLGGATEDVSRMNAEEAVENGDGAGEGRGEATGVEKEGEGGEDGENGGPQVHVDAGAAENLVEGEASVAEMEKKVSGAENEEMEVLESCDAPSGVKEAIAWGGKGEESRDDGKGNGNANEEDNEEAIEEESDEDNEEDEDLSDYIHEPLTERKKQKDLEIFVGGLDKGAGEEDLVNVFGKFGEIKDVRIVMHPTKKKSKGFAFIRYATLEQAKNVLSELKDGIEVRGKRVKISASQDNDTLYMGNISKVWAKEQVLETLKGYGIEQIEDIHLPEDSNNEGKIKGFALLEFTTHSDAVAAFKRLRMPDAIFGRDRSAKVAFAQTPMHPSEEALSKVKTVYIEGLSDSWDDKKIKEVCEQYGEIEKVKLSRNLGTKRKDFGFVTFASRESALACVEGINIAQIGDGEAKVKANIAKPHFRGRLQKQGTRGGFKVKKESEKMAEVGTSKKKGRAKSKGAEKKEKAVAAEKATTEEKEKALPKSKSIDGGQPNKPLSVSKGQAVGAPSKPENRKRKSVPLKVDGKGKRDRHHGYNRRPEKKRRGAMPSRQTDAFRNLRSHHSFRKGPVHGASSISFGNQFASGYAAPMSSYPAHSYTAVSGSKRHRSDMEPHAGYLEPAVGQQGPAYAGYHKPALGMPIQTRAGYPESAVGAQSHHQYNYGMRSTGGYDGLGSNGSAYGAGSARLPTYVANPTTYAYEGGSSAGGYHRGSVPYPRGRQYY
ncbi:polyadenylate-binding protein, cytoplasmic and nuclear-like [Malania oleifera]|uniref:polyadenylate-binding protein, cytoplasmic and nuclear-like n=1 Tax=Malania oleifera TaxID=397392 RepID=UPI0025AEB7EA|nr:polyadenylate-binding protein, cytoplasmic and nuclear-like [Malania oleifera]